MRTAEILSVVFIAVIISFLSAVALFGVFGVASGVGAGTIASAFLSIVTITVVATLIFYIGLRRYMAERARKTAMMTLSEDERKIVRKMIEMGNEAQQKDLWREIDFSRSKLSALLNNLVEKEVIMKRRHRRTNLVRLTEDFKGK
ncbi:hypothetical protein AKJ53_00505 [candidate division MSBL1 archaeon SCGC-AAA382F02]|uniref:DUF7343 domain-containing protein n=1 Tax=candidate division MSBL1 archaeon SCGC-AAA382F02 TaxID=1698282 RepID=A0A133VIW8_9EURY|nr:hypothetical protein AKJ53_00505 [candidate division MSBL1 archaeon SCGC-AAA382F02]